MGSTTHDMCVEDAIEGFTDCACCSLKAVKHEVCQFCEATHTKPRVDSSPETSDPSSFLVDHAQRDDQGSVAEKLREAGVEVPKSWSVLQIKALWAEMNQKMEDKDEGLVRKMAELKKAARKKKDLIAFMRSRTSATFRTRPSCSSTTTPRKFSTKGHRHGRES